MKDVLPWILLLVGVLATVYIIYEVDQKRTEKKVNIYNRCMSEGGELILRTSDGMYVCVDDVKWVEGR